MKIANRPRVHIFWQKRIRANDTSTPWWYPSQTGGGELREDRLVFPIPQGVHWREVGAILLESAESKNDDCQVPNVELKQEDAARSAFDTRQSTFDITPAAKKHRRSKKTAAPATRALIPPGPQGGFWFEEQATVVQQGVEEKSEKPARNKPAKVAKKIDPRLIAMSRELRDQWTERAEQIVQPMIAKHDVKRIAETSNGGEVRRLDAA